MKTEHILWGIAILFAVIWLMQQPNLPVRLKTLLGVVEQEDEQELLAEVF